MPAGWARTQVISGRSFPVYPRSARRIRDSARVVGAILRRRVGTQRNPKFANASLGGLESPLHQTKGWQRDGQSSDITRRRIQVSQAPIPEVRARPDHYFELLRRFRCGWHVKRIQRQRQALSRGLNVGLFTRPAAEKGSCASGRACIAKLPALGRSKKALREHVRIA
jgi:hypothetical protein